MSYDFSAFKKGLQEVEEWLANEYLGVRTGRATPAILDSVFVESYGSRTLIKHVASVTIEDAKTIRVSPWDKGQIKAIEKAIGEANLGLGASADAQGVRVFFPDLTAERRTALMKVVREKLEHARVSIRGERDDVWSDIQEKEKNHEIAEDDKFRLKDDMQKLVDAANQRLEEMSERKEKEISE
ncbi:MAG: ribosome recycling factor [Candidatus Paceibacterota bacterium]|jgi:ribosome recycling factor|nr:ribosome recycling factor [Candidatus Paceibacterota bacterium]